MIKKNLILYHGSRGGIVENIKPVSRKRCDFGTGFYMGSNQSQAKSLVSNDPSPYYYKLSLDMKSLDQDRVLRLTDMDWAYFVLFNRGKLETIKGSNLYMQCARMAENKDLIIGPIADDAMNESMNRFLHNQITDKAFLESIRALDYGVQYVAKTEKACSLITVIEEKKLMGKELSDALAVSSQSRKKGWLLAEEVQMRYRREGLFFDEILSDHLRTVKKKRGKGL